METKLTSATIDLHCHLLPGLDDGAVDLDDAVAMARQAAADGIDAVCATPHIRPDHAVSIAELASRRRHLTTTLAEAACPTRVLPGGEVAVGELERLGAAELRALSLGGGGRWILIEPSPGPLDGELEAAVRRLHARGFRSLIAHPERHPAPDLHGALRALIAGGALVQATAAFLHEESTREGMLALAAAGLIHVLGSDAHSSRAGRPVVLSRAIDALRSVMATAEHLEWIAETAPRAIVEGRDLTPPF